MILNTRETEPIRYSVPGSPIIDKSILVFGFDHTLQTVYFNLSGTIQLRDIVPGITLLDCFGNQITVSKKFLKK